MLIICYLLSLLKTSLSWQLVDALFNTATFTEDGGFFKYGTTANPIHIVNCNTASLSVVAMDVNNRGISKKYQLLPPHYLVKVISDVIRAYSWDLEWSYILIDEIIQYSAQTQSIELPMYGSQCFAGNMHYKTIVIETAHSTSELLLSYYTTLDEGYTNEVFAVRNIQVFVKTCFQTCLTCSGPEPTDCLSCYIGTPNNEGSCMHCNQWPNLYLQIGVACLNQCLPFYWPDKNHICRSLKSRQVTNVLSILQASPLQDQTQVNLRINFSKNGFLNQSSYILECLPAFLGPLYEEHGVEKTVFLPSKTIMISIRINVVLVGEWRQGFLTIMINDVPIGRLYFFNGFTQTDNIKLMHESLQGSCDSLKSVEYHLEMQHNYSSDCVVVLIQTLNTQLSDEFWGFRNFEIDALICSPPCEVCSTYDKCTVCSAGYVNYKGSCLSECPPYSRSIQFDLCQDFDEETPKSTYNFKAYYDLSDDDTLANGHFELVSQSGTNFEKDPSVYFSYLNDKRVLGGSLVWLNAKFQKTFEIPQSHYAVSLFMKTALLDSFAGTFQYQINSNPAIMLSRTSPGIEGNIWGNFVSDYTISVNELINHQEQTLTLSLECLAGAVQIYSAACAVYDIFLLIHECPTYCLACLDYNTCTNWELETHHFNKITLKCDDGYFLNEEKSACLTCEIEHCELCTLQGCFLCSDGFQLVQGQSNPQGVCQCLKSEFVGGNQCQACHPLCQECYGPTEFQCFACNQSFNRLLINSVCQCANFYQEIPQQLICQEICGDMFVVGSEECDDGNDYRFDGCHNCKFECQTECQICFQGQCLECLPDWLLIKQTHRCVKQLKKQTLQTEMCGNGIVEGLEQCDDSNLIPFDGCFSCQFSCSDGCQDCLQGQCLKCLVGWTISEQQLCVPDCGDGIISGQESCDFGKDSILEGCIKCSFQCPNHCNICKFGKCFQCLEEFYLLGNSCQPKCSQYFLTTFEQCQNMASCADQFVLPAQKILLDKKCESICGLECALCQDSQCLQCNSGYKLQLKRCYPICGDGIIVSFQECDDINYDYKDRCKQCRYSCPFRCKECSYGKCLACQDNLVLIHDDCIFQTYNQFGSLTLMSSEFDFTMQQCMDFKFIQYIKGQESYCDENLEVEPPQDSKVSLCIQMCSNTLAIYLRNYLQFCKLFCDDNNTIFNQIMKDLQQINEKHKPDLQQCLMPPSKTQNQALRAYSQELCEIPFCTEECLICKEGSCAGCLSYWQLDEFDRCLPICGDQVIVGTEECDDGNLIQFDGCFECKYQCEDECYLCERGLCIECVLGWFPSKGRCMPICGDGLVVGDEECDDGEGDPNKMCDQCKFQCNKPCAICTHGICQQCELGLQLKYDDGRLQCMPSCGDGIVVQNLEQCDDSNINNLDGCNQNCEIENGWGCVTTNNKSVCQLSSFPKLLLKMIDNGKIRKQVLLHFSRPLKQVCLISFQYSLYFYDNKPIAHTIQLLPKVEPSYQTFEDIQFNLNITFFENTFATRLDVVLNEPNCLIDQFYSKVYNEEGSLYLKQTNIISEQEQISAETLSQINSTILYCYIGLFVFSLFLGNLNLIWNLLDLLQFFSYMKFINVSLPQNLQFFFKIFSIVSLEPLTDLFYINELFQSFNHGELPVLETDQKFKEFQINALFIKNISTNLVLLMIAFGFHYFQKFILLKLLYQQKWSTTNLKRWIQILLLELRKVVAFQLDQFYYKDLVRNFMANAYDLNFALFLQLKSLQYVQDELTILSFCCALSTFIIQIIIFIKFVYIQWNIFINNQGVSFLNNTVFETYFSLFEGIKWNKLDTAKYNGLVLLNKSAFMFILIFLQNQPLVQIILITLIDALLLIFVKICAPIALKSDTIKNYLHKTVVITICITFTVFELNMQSSQKFLLFRQYQLLGWFVIGLITTNLVLQFLIDAIIQLAELNLRFRKYEVKKQIQQYSIRKQSFSFEMILSFVNLFILINSSFNFLLLLFLLILIFRRRQEIVLKLKI